MSYTVYGASLSPFVRKVRVFLAEKGLDYTLEQVNIFPAPDWFVEISPLKRIPVLRDESDGQNVTFPDSSVICAYLEKKEGGPALYPADPRDYGRALWLEEYCDSEMAATAGMGVFRPIVVNKLMGKEPDRETADKTVAEKLPRFFDYLEKELTGRHLHRDPVLQSGPCGRDAGGRPLSGAHPLSCRDQGAALLRGLP